MISEESLQKIEREILNNITTVQIDYKKLNLVLQVYIRGAVTQALRITYFKEILN